MSHPIRDPNSDGRDWWHRGISISDQRSAWPHVAGKWCVHHPDGIHATPVMTKREAVHVADKLVDDGNAAAAAYADAWKTLDPCTVLERLIAVSSDPMVME